MKKKIGNIDSAVRKYLNYEDFDERIISTFSPCKELIEKIKKRIDNCTVKEEKRLLTPIPNNWTIDKIVKEFNVSTYITRSSTLLYKSRGIIPLLENIVGNKFSQNIVDEVINLYNSDNISRICPGKKYCRKIKGITYQKRMYNIREIFNIFLDEYKLKYDIDQYDINH